MCGTPKGVKAETDGKEKDSQNIKYAKQRAKMLEQGKQSWIKRMDADNKIRWVRSYKLDEEDYDTLKSEDVTESMSVRQLKNELRLLQVDSGKAIEKKDLVALLSAYFEAIPSFSATKLKAQLRIVGVDDSKCVEKKDLARLLRRSILVAVRQQFDGWVRSFNIRGELSWVPANKWSMDAIIRLPNGQVLVAVEELRNAAMLPFARKLGWFRHKVGRMRVPWSQAHQKIRVRRRNLLADAYDNFRVLNSLQFRQIFKFEFVGEPALDAGGVAREWFSEVGRALFNVDFGLFSYGDVDNLCYQINQNSGMANDNHLEYFRFVGRILGKALFDQQLVAAHLTLPLYKHILGWPITLQDLDFVNMSLSKSMKDILGVTDAEDLMLDFTTTNECFGKMAVVPLKVGGDDIDVTNANRHEYVQLILRHHMFDRVKLQLSQLLQGFYEVIPPALVSIFDFQELELLINGLPQIDVMDWEQNTLYKGVFKASHPVIKWFWEVVSELNQEMRARLLQFSTGTSRVPVQGFKALQSSDGKLNPFTIKSAPVKTSIFPIAHTCFNRIDLPVYKSLADCKKYVMIAIQMEATGFGIE